MVKRFWIVVDKSPHGVYYPDSYITGTVGIQLENPRILDHIKVFLRGEASVEWSSSTCYLTTDVCYASVRFLNRYIVLWTADGHRAPLDEGTHTFPFKFRLPSLDTRLPPSFESLYGSIQYYIEGKLGTGQYARDVRVKEHIKVAEVVDAGSEWAQSKCFVRCRKDVWLVGAGSVYFEAEVPRRGYCLGERVPVTVTVDNSSGRRVRIRTSLVQTTIYSAQGETKRTTKSLASVTSSCIDKQRSVTLQFKNLFIPKTVPTMTSCKIITIQYSLKVTAVVPWTVETSRCLPLVIGNMPTRGDSV